MTRGGAEAARLGRYRPLYRCVAGAPASSVRESNSRLGHGLSTMIARSGMSSYEKGHTAIQLRSGPSRLPRERVVEIQRARILAAAVQAVEEAGYTRLSVGAIICRARVSRKTFYDLFSDREDCFCAIVEQTVSHLRQIVTDAYRQENSWRDGVRAALTNVVAFLEDEPALANICVVEAFRAGERVSACRASALDDLAKGIDLGRLDSRTNHHPPDVSAEAISGGILALIHTRLVGECDEPLSDLIGPIMYMIVLPYLGARVARQELNRPPVRARRDGSSKRSTGREDPLEGLQIRLTYRTIRVLAVVGRHPGASNREVAEHADISDQGQISKLLGRLARLRLVENHGEGQEKGAANAWQLTTRGAELVRAMRPHDVLA